MSGARLIVERYAGRSKDQGRPQVLIDRPLPDELLSVSLHLPGGEVTLAAARNVLGWCAPRSVPVRVNGGVFAPRGLACNYTGVPHVLDMAVGGDSLRVSFIPEGADFAPAQQPAESTENHEPFSAKISAVLMAPGDIAHDPGEVRAVNEQVVAPGQQTTLHFDLEERLGLQVVNTGAKVACCALEGPGETNSGPILVSDLTKVPNAVALCVGRPVVDAHGSVFKVFDIQAPSIEITRGGFPILALAGGGPVQGPWGGAVVELQPAGQQFLPRSQEEIAVRVATFTQQFIAVRRSGLLGL